jgi:ElaB/YqjD/DUF883 family membrane-anchored ribosome-binding protein
VDNELEVIRHQMEEKRSSLADKLDALENQVIGKVQDTTQEVTNIVHEVKEGITDVVQEVKSTVGSVTEGVQETVESVKETFDFREHIRQHPWLCLGGAVAAGFAGAYFLGPHSRTERTRSWQPCPPESGGTSAPASLSDLSAPGPEPVKQQGESTTDHILSVLGDTGTQALTKVKELAVGTLMGVLGEVVVNSLPAALKSEASTLLTDLTTRLGGKIIDFSKGNQQPEGERNDDRNQAEMGGSMGTTQRSDQEPVGQRDRGRVDSGPGGLRADSWSAQGTDW